MNDPFNPNLTLSPAALNAPVRIYLADAETYALVSPEDAHIASLLRWRLHHPANGCMKNGRGSGGLNFYARATVFRDAEGKTRDIYLHRFLLAVNDGMRIDHIDGDGLNCTRENMREVTRSENARNRI